MRERKPTRFELRLPADLGDEIDRWRRGQSDLPTRAEAARRLIELGLKAMPEPASVEGLVDHYTRVGRPDLADALGRAKKDIKP